MIETVGRKFARLTTNVVIREPRLWRVFRPLMRLQFSRLAPKWDAMRTPVSLAPYERALEQVQPAPRRALDVGTGTGIGALTIARRFPEAEVIGVDVSDAMLEQARRNTTAEVQGRVRFERGDAAALPFADGSFELVAHANMIPFFDEVKRVLSPRGHVLFAFSSGAETPIYVPPDRLRSELERRGFTDFAEVAAGNGIAFLARKSDRP